MGGRNLHECTSVARWSNTSRSRPSAEKSVVLKILSALTQRTSQLPLAHNLRYPSNNWEKSHNHHPPKRTKKACLWRGNRTKNTLSTKWPPLELFFDPPAGMRNFHPQKAWEISAGNFQKGWKYVGTGGGLVQETAAKHRKSPKAHWAVLGLPNSSSSLALQLLWVDADHDLARKKTRMSGDKFTPLEPSSLTPNLRGRRLATLLSWMLFPPSSAWMARQPKSQRAARNQKEQPTNT